MRPRRGSPSEPPPAQRPYIDVVRNSLCRRLGVEDGVGRGAERGMSCAWGAFETAVDQGGGAVDGVRGARLSKGRCSGGRHRLVGIEEENKEDHGSWDIAEDAGVACGIDKGSRNEYGVAEGRMSNESKTMMVTRKRGGDTGSRRRAQSRVGRR